eukprot:scaffold67444_cov24-Cyclotella_meneghiniana.AAC.3
MHHLLPSDAGIDIYTKNCDKCVYVNNLSPGTAYSVRGRAKIAEGIAIILISLWLLHEVFLQAIQCSGQCCVGRVPDRHHVRVTAMGAA